MTPYIQSLPGLYIQDKKYIQKFHMELGQLVPVRASLSCAFAVLG